MGMERDGLLFCLLEEGLKGERKLEGSSFHYLGSECERGCLLGREIGRIKVVPPIVEWSGSFVPKKGLTTRGMIRGERQEHAPGLLSYCMNKNRNHPGMYVLVQGYCCSYHNCPCVCVYVCVFPCPPRL